MFAGGFTSTSTPPIPPDPTLKLLTISGTTTSVYKKWDLYTSYLGAFRLPPYSYGAETPNQNNLSYNRRPVIGLSSSSKLLIGGGSNGDNYKSIGEFNIPALSLSGGLEFLNIAGFSKNFMSPFASAPNIGANWGTAPQVGGICTYNNRVMVNYCAFYDGSNTANRSLVVLDNAATLSGASARGSFAVLANPNTSHASGWVSPIPAAYQSSLGGTHIFGQSSSNDRSIESRFPIGPSAIVYNADAANSVTGSSPITAGSTLSTTTVLDYSLANGLTPAANLSDAGTKWNHLSTAQYGFIVPGTRTYCVLGFSAGNTSGISYGDPPWGAPKGFYQNTSTDIYNYYWLYNVDDMLAVKAGSIAAYTPVPYEYGPVYWPFDNGLNWWMFTVGGAAFDPANNKLYISLVYGDDSQGAATNLPLILCYDMS
jgi:hypothetical protein